LPASGDPIIRVLPGQYYDAETGTNYNYFRDYDPTIGRYEQSDPIGLKGGLNTYLYVRDTPLALSDPFGLVPCACRLQSGSYNNRSGKFECKYSCKCYCSPGGRNKEFPPVETGKNAEFDPTYPGPCREIFLFDSGSNRFNVFNPFWWESWGWNGQMNDFCNCKTGTACC
jgi:RHS repeat-associated protein